jgi:hypothetical protein
VADLAVLEVDEFYGYGEVGCGVSHGELDDLGAWDSAHVLSAGVGHSLYLSEVAGLHGFSTMLVGLGLKKLLPRVGGRSYWFSGERDDFRGNFVAPLRESWFFCVLVSQSFFELVLTVPVNFWDGAWSFSALEFWESWSIVFPCLSGADRVDPFSVWLNCWVGPGGDVSGCCFVKVGVGLVEQGFSA